MQLGQRRQRPDLPGQVADDIGRQVQAPQSRHAEEYDGYVLEAVAAEVEVGQAGEEGEVLRERAEDVLGDV